MIRTGRRVLRRLAALALILGACGEVMLAAEAEHDRLSLIVGRYLNGIWTGRGEDAYGIGCAVASDLVVFGAVGRIGRKLPTPNAPLTDRARRGARRRAG